VERPAWTDVRLDDRFDQIDKRFDQVDQRFDRVDQELGVLRSEMNDLRLVIIRGNWALMAGLIGVIAAILARGV
jgi:hypothetical protein